MRAAFETTAGAALQDDSVPVDEAERLVSLHRLGLLDTAPSAAFDGVTRLAAAALRVPILLVSLVDQNRVWFKSRIGINLRETARQGSLCDYAIWHRQPFIVRDAAADARLRRTHWCRARRTCARISAFHSLPATVSPWARFAPWTTELRDFGDVEAVVLSEFAKIAEDLLCSQELASKSDSVSAIRDGA